MPKKEKENLLWIYYTREIVEKKKREHARGKKKRRAVKNPFKIRVETNKKCCIKKTKKKAHMA